MKQRAPLAAVNQQAASGMPSVIGLDLGDKWTRYCVLDSAGVILQEDRVRNSAESLRKRFAQLASTRIVIETGTHTPRVSRVTAKIRLDRVVLKIAQHRDRAVDGSTP
jgi:predicted NBD/HSP70 family sugar kinase